MFEQLTEHVWRLPCDAFADRPNIGYVAGSRLALLFEAGNSAAHAELVKGELDRLGLRRPDFVCVSHWHWDHTFGLHAWETWGAVTIAGAQTNQKLREVSRWTWDEEAMRERLATREDIQFCNDMILREYPDRGKIEVVPAQMEFESTLSIDLGGVTCRLLHVGGPHSDDSVACYVPEDRLVLLGDSDCKDLYGEPWDFDINHRELMDVELNKIPFDQQKVRLYLDIMRGLDFDLCMSGHIPPMSKGDLLAAFE